MKVKGLVLRLAGIEHSRFPHYSVERIGDRLAGACFSDEFGLLRDMPIPDWWAQIIGVADTPSIQEVGSLLFAPYEFRFRWIPDYKVVPYLSCYCLGLPEDALVFSGMPQLRKPEIVRQRLLGELAFLASKPSFRRWAVNPIVDAPGVLASHVALQVRSGVAAPKNPLDRPHFVNNVYSMNLYGRKIALLDGFSRYADKIHGRLVVTKVPGLHYSALKSLANMPDFKGRIVFSDSLHGES